MSKILKVHGLQVFDSRGIPTVSCKITLENGLSKTINWYLANRDNIRL